MYSLPNLRSSKERGALPRRKPCISTFCTSLRYALSEAFSSSSQVTSTLRTASLPGNFSTETFTFPPRSMKTNQRMLFMIKYRDLHTLPCILISREQSQLSWEAQRGNHHPTPGRELERETGIEPATFSLARRCSTTEPLPHNFITHNLYPHTELDRSCPWWAVRDSNSHGSSPTDPKSALSTNFSNRPNYLYLYMNTILTCR